MITLTGDTHGVGCSKLGVMRLSADIINDSYRQLGLNYEMGRDKNDYIIVCGDFGYIWDFPNSKHRHYIEAEQGLDWLNAQSYTTLFIDGNHENFTRLNNYPIKQWCGGKVHVIRDNVLHLMRGEVYNICGNSIFTMGGATSPDKLYRIEGRSWWREELPNYTEFENALSNLDRVGWKVDYVITHCIDNTTQMLINPLFNTDCLTTFLDEVQKKLKFSGWYFGHYHIIKTFRENRTVLYDNYIPLGLTINDIQRLRV